MRHNKVARNISNVTGRVEKHLFVVYIYIIVLCDVFMYLWIFKHKIRSKVVEPSET